MFLQKPEDEANNFYLPFSREKVITLEPPHCFSFFKSEPLQKAFPSMQMYFSFNRTAQQIKWMFLPLKFSNLFSCTTGLRIS